MDKFDYNQPNTRERLAARRRARTAPARARGAAATRPGPRRAVSSWVSSGRLVSLLLLIAGLGGLMYAATAPRFTVQTIDVNGTQAMNANVVADLAGAQGQSIWLVDTDQIVARLKTNAYIENARASLTLPDRLTITVSERRPELRWQSGSTLYLIDASGRVLDSDSTAPMTTTLVIEDSSGRALKPNDIVDSDALLLGRVLSLRLPAELGLQPSHIGWNTDRHMYITTADNRTIIFGTSDNLDEKLAVLGTVLHNDTAFTMLDLRPSTPFYRNDTTATPPPEATAQP
ncbi:MAG: FtsQ-type POTRA domain-containing protein [Chloroflexi bacterium SZAS-1]|jgi:cell division protein FtsQ|nr:FtsQ-type POTRA domain-containing protein [Chloroflexi bacterium SZAS-1]